MTRRMILSAAMSLIVLAAGGRAFGDAAGDLSAGQAALAAGDAAKALPLLVSAAQALPQSVEAQFALARAYLLTGDLDKAVERLRMVLKLSPEHAQAKQLFDGLTGRKKTFDEKLAYVRALLDQGLYGPAQGEAQRLIAEPLDAAQRLAARMALAEAVLWPQFSTSGLPLILQAVQEAAGMPSEGPARAMAALALVTSDKAEDRQSAHEMLAKTGDLEEPCRRWARAARLLLDLAPANAAETSTALLEPLLLPPGGYRDGWMNKVTGQLLSVAQSEAQRGDSAGPFRIIGPMLAAAAGPVHGADGPALDLKTGWLQIGTSDTVPHLDQIVQILAMAGRNEFDRQGATSALTGHLWAGLVLQAAAQPGMRDAPRAVNTWINLASDLASLSRPTPERKKGEALSTADAVQFDWLRSITSLATDESQWVRVVDLAMAQVGRYEAAGDLEGGLAWVVTIENPARDAVRPNVTESRLALPPGPAHQKLMTHAAQKYAQLGQKAFNEAATSLNPDANRVLNPSDQAALLIAAVLRSAYPATLPGNDVAQGIVERYAAAGKWEAAGRAAELVYRAAADDAGKWAAVRLILRQGMAEEDRRLAANQGLGKALNPYVAEAVKQARGILLANLDEPTRDRVVALADPLVWRYVGLDRYDLAQAVIDTVSPPAEEAVFAGPAARVWLTEWPIWMKALLAERQGDAALAAAAKEFDGVGKLTLQPEHRTSLDLQNQLIAKNPASPVMNGRVEHLLAIPARYRQYKAYDVAAGILADFVKAHPNLTATERVAFIRVEVLLDKARQAFADRPDKEKPPAAVSAEYAVAIDAIADFIKAHPTGDYSLGAMNLLVNVSRTYGEAGAWPLTRTVLARFKAAVPDFRAPERLKFLEAVTYLGELDRAHGLQLLTPPPPPGTTPAGGPALSLDSRSDEVTVAEDRLRVNVYDARDLSSALRPSPADQPAEPGPRRTPPPAQASGESWDGTDQVLARVRQAEQQQVQRIAMLERKLEEVQVRGHGQAAGPQGGQAAPQQQPDIVLPEGPVLSEAELKRQDAAADAAYAILIDLVKAGRPTALGVAAQARAEVVWLIGFFEAQRRTDRAVALIEQFLTDRPSDGGRVALAYRALVNRLSWAGQRRRAEKIDQAWVDARHGLFEEARAAIAAFIETYQSQRDWVHRAQMLAVTSLQQEANLAAAVSAPRAGGLWAQSARAVIDLSVAVPDHPERSDFPAHLWTIADRLSAIDQQDQAIYVLSQIVVRFPSDARATQAVMRIAQLHARNLAAPLKAVETYQEYLSLTGDDASVRSQIFAIAEQLAAQKRYLEALHVYGVFVDGFPTDERAPQALLSMGRIHQSNEAWDDALRTYRRILGEYEGVAQVPEVKLAIAECQVNLSLWGEARRLYQDFLQVHSSHAGAATARARQDTLKALERYQTLLADQQVTRNKDDAQFQIARIVQEKLGYLVKAVAEYRKVLAAWPTSHLADDAQLEIGKALIDLHRLDEARAELWKVVSSYPTSPLADNALYLIGQSYERQAERLAAVTLAGAREAAFEAGQRGAYGRFQYQVAEQQKDIAERRKELRQAGKGAQLELEEAYSASRFNLMNDPNVALMTREAEMLAETESALQVANRQDRINEAYRQAVAAYTRAARDYPLGDATDESLLRMAQIFETTLKDTKAAMETYQKVIKFFPGTPVAEDAAWKVATFHEQEGQYTEAVIAYRDFIRNYPASARVADAQYAMAEALEKLGRWVEAMDAYQTFRDKFASHPKAPAAREQEMWIKAYRM